MVVSTGIPPATIITKGVGESEPITKPGECKGKKSKKLIACLAFDRRVEVEVTATRTAK
jgi:OOP family OmpA-OmpF porin